RPTSAPAPTSWVWLSGGGIILALLILGIINMPTTIIACIALLAGLRIWFGAQRGRATYTEAGMVEAERWRRFKTYLLNIKEYGDLAAAQEIIDRYFGYAVALGVEEVVLAQATEMGALRPVWMPSPQMQGQPSRRAYPNRPAQPTPR